LSIDSLVDILRDVSEISVKPKSAWHPTADSFARFLAFLDNGKDTNGESYLEMQRRLVGYFTRKGCVTPEELADETLNRVSRRLDEEGSIEVDAPAHYCYITARFVFLEHLRATQTSNVTVDEARSAVDRRGYYSSEEYESERKEKMLECLDECASRLAKGNRDLIFKYYFGNARAKIRNRSSMAHELGISVNALSIKAYRIRRTLEACVGKCAGEGVK